MKEKFEKFCFKLKNSSIEESKALIKNEMGFYVRYLLFREVPRIINYKGGAVKEYSLSLGEYEEKVFHTQRTYKSPFNMEKFLEDLGYEKINYANLEALCSIKFLLEKDGKIWKAKYDNVDLFDTGYYETKLVKIEIE